MVDNNETPDTEGVVEEVHTAEAQQAEQAETPKAKQNGLEYDEYSRPQFSVLRSALRRSEAKTVGLARLADGTMAYRGKDAEGKVVKRGRIAADVDFPSKKGTSK